MIELMFLGDDGKLWFPINTHTIIPFKDMDSTASTASSLSKTRTTLTEEVIDLKCWSAYKTSNNLKNLDILLTMIFASCNTPRLDVLGEGEVEEPGEIELEVPQARHPL